MVDVVAGCTLDDYYIYYDAEGNPAFIYDRYEEETFAYMRNLQGDIIGLVNSAGNVVVRYYYDAWGNIIWEDHGSNYSDLAQKNPLRYRGYVYDEETGMYYVLSRYYSPDKCRWINADNRFDDGAGFAGYNLFSYCANDPVILFDPEGGFVISTLTICVIVGFVVGSTIGGVVGNQYASSKCFSGWDRTRCVLTGAAVGGVGGGIIGYVATPLVINATGAAGVSVSSSGLSTVAAVGTSFGKIGTLIVNNGQQIIDWERITLHGWQRMTSRGVTPNMIELWVKTGKALQQAGDKVLYVTRQGAVVVDKAGRVITAYTSRDFDQGMQKIIEKLFGR